MEHQMKNAKLRRIERGLPPPAAGRSSLSFLLLSASLLALLSVACASGPSVTPTPAAVPVAPQTAPQAPPPVNLAEEGVTPYRIGTQDLLRVEVFGLEEMRRQVRVLSDGSISLPLLGAVPVLGLSVPEAEALIGRKLRESQLIQEPFVSLFIEEYRSRLVRVQGAVEKPGSYEILGAATLLDVLSDAGGLLHGEQEPPARRIYVLRAGATGQEARLEIDTEALIDRGDLAYNVPVYPGDLVIVPYSRRSQIFVDGAVARPGPVDFFSHEGITVLQAVAAAGGATQRANLRTVYVIRKLPSGEQSRIKVDLKKIRKGRAEDLHLLRNDVVVVGEWFL